MTASCSDQPDNAPPVAEAAANLRAILGTVVDAIVTIDMRGMIRQVNQATVRMFGFEESELIGRNVNILMPSPYREEHDGYIRNYLESGDAKIIGIGREVTGRKKNGTLFPVDLAVSEVTFGESRLFTGVIRDMTDRIELKTAEQKLIQAERLAAIGQMMTGLAHESRNALQRTRACLDMLELDIADRPELIDLIRRSQRALDELQRLYEEVRGYAAPLKLECSDCDIAELCTETWDQVAPENADRNVRLHTQCDAASPQCRIDRSRMQQVFRNIFENALAAVAENGAVRVGCRNLEQHGRSYLEVAVRDDGPGLNTEQAARIFEPFYTTKTRGTGLGMAIAKRIVEAHGGTIEVGRSGPPGAEIILTLPR